MMLRSVIEAGALSSNCDIDIVFSKWDAVLGHPADAALISFIADTREDMRRTAERISVPHFFEIAARPRNTKLPFAFGLPTLLRSWLREPVCPARVTLYVPDAQTDAREAMRFAKAVVEDQRLAEFYDVQWV
jgi:hypothetical protein